MIFSGIFVLFLSSVQTGMMAWQVNENEMGDITRFGSEEEKNFEFSPLFGDTGGDGELHDEYVMGVNNAEELADSMENEVVGSHVTNYDPKSSENMKSNKMFEGINKILDDIYTEHKKNGKVLETNIEESKDLQSKIQNLKKGSKPSVVSEQMKYLTNSMGLVITKQDRKVSLYVNITKDNDDHELVDKDGHKIHIHIPHQVLEKMAETGDDHVIHIDGGLKDNYVIQKNKNNIETQDHETEDLTGKLPSEIEESTETKNNIETQEYGIENHIETQKNNANNPAQENGTENNNEVKGNEVKGQFDWTKNCIVPCI